MNGSDGEGILIITKFVKRINFFVCMHAQCAAHKSQSTPTNHTKTTTKTHKQRDNTKENINIFKIRGWIAVGCASI